MASGLIEQKKRYISEVLIKKVGKIIIIMIAPIVNG